MGSQVELVVKNPPANEGDIRNLGSLSGQENPLEKSMATHSSTLAWRIPWTEEPGGLLSIGLQKLRHDGNDLACNTKLICNGRFISSVK